MCDYLFGYSKAADDILHLSILDLVVSLGFYPLGEIVYDRKHIDLLVEGHRKLPHNVHPTLHEQRRGKDGGESLWKEV